MKNKTRSDSALAALRPAQQSALYDWLLELGYTQTLKKIALPAPEGLGLRAHRTTLHRFFKAYSKSIRLEEHSPATEQASENSLVFCQASGSSIDYRAYQLATEEWDRDSFTRAARWWKWKKDIEQRERDSQLKERALQLEHQRIGILQYHAEIQRANFEFSAARSALEALDDLKAIMLNAQIDNREKIERSRIRLFGAPKPLTPPPGLTPDAPQPELTKNLRVCELSGDPKT